MTEQEDADWAVEDPRDAAAWRAAGQGDAVPAARGTRHADEEEAR